MKFSFVALFFALVALVAAQSTDSPFYITYPLTGAKLKAGDEIDLTWINGLDQKVKVTVIEGADSKAMHPTGISFNVEGDDGSYTWKVPNTLSSSATYAFQFEYKNDKGATQYSYSGPVAVTGGTGSSSSSSAASASSSVSPSSSAAKSSSAASSSSAPSSSARASSSASSSAASSSAPASSSTSAASSTPSPSNSAAGIKITTIVLAVPALVLAALCA